MNRIVSWLALVSLSTSFVAASEDDRQKAEKQLRKITAMATDKVGRRMVSMSIADSFKMSRPALVEDRRRLGLEYGAFFLALKLVARGAKVADIANGLKSGKNIWQIGDEQHADWKQIEADAKKQNGRIEDYIYRHFLNKKNQVADDEREVAEKYDILHDAVRTDFNVTPQEMVDAQARYIFWRDLAGNSQGSGHMTARERQASSYDHADARHGTHGISAPSAGGLPEQ